jgi:hypothetical protein
MRAVAARGKVRQSRTAAKSKSQRESDMSPQPTSAQPRITVADLCQAIGERRIAPQCKGDEYVVRGSDIRRLTRGNGSVRVLPGQHSRRPAC